MPHIPESILTQQPPLPGLELRSRGKVRDTYLLPNHPGKMLVVASDRCSIFDFVLPILIPGKGAVLNALNHLWVTQVTGGICQCDLIACGQPVADYLPEDLRHDIDLLKRASVVHIFPKPEVEDIVRFYLTGSGWESYRQTGKVFGHSMPKGLLNGSKLPFPIYTPTTKEEEGHDQPISFQTVEQRYGSGRERLSLQLGWAMSAHAESRGIILADTKLELSYGAGVVLVDEKGTPDSSRFWDPVEWERACSKGELPPSLDKQFLRNWGKKAEIEKDSTGRKREPTNPVDRAFVDTQLVPEEVVRESARINRLIFKRLASSTLESYQRSFMGIR